LIPNNAVDKCFVSHLECPNCGQIHEAGRIQTVCKECGRPLLVIYDLDALGKELNKDSLTARVSDLWRYREFLPVRDARNIVSLGETMTPVIEAITVGPDLGMANLYVKDEGRLPTGSFKARGLAMAVTMARELGVTRATIPTAGNAGGALAAYGARAGMEVFVFCPEDVPDINAEECTMTGAVVCVVNGLIDDCGRIVREGSEQTGWFDISTLREPYRIEGKKTMGLELAEQLNWELPDAIFYPTGGGTGLIGMWKAFNELEAMGWIGKERPRLISVQAEGCAPIVRAFEQGAERAEPWESAHTVASGIRVPSAIGDFLILRAIRETRGTAIAVSDEAILAAQRELAEKEGIVAAPEGAATLAALKRALETRMVDRDERIVLFNTGSGLKYPMHSDRLKIDKNLPVDYERILNAVQK
jgi:threonine synthase